MSGYELSKKWFDFSRENPELITTNQTALFFWICEKWNAMGKPDKFGLPTFEAMGVLGIHSPKTYKKAFDSLAEFGMIEVIQYSKNQFTSNIIAIVKNTKAMTEQLPKQSQSNDQSNDQSKCGASTLYINDINKEILKSSTTKKEVADDDGLSVVEKEKLENQKNGVYNLEEKLSQESTEKKMYNNENIRRLLSRERLSDIQGAKAIRAFTDFCDSKNMFPRTFGDSRDHFVNWLAKKDKDIFRI